MRLYDYEEQIAQEKEETYRKDRMILELNEKLNSTKYELDEALRIKKEQLEKLLSLK